MKNIVGYIEKMGNKSFSKKPFSEVDSLVLCNLSYQIFEGYVYGIDDEDFFNHKDIYLRDLVENETSLKDLIQHTLDLPKNRVFLKKLIESKRFGNLRINFFKSVFDPKNEIQFAAMTFKLDNKINYIAFRGTDITILGWKEDFNMALLSEIPSQALAVDYVNKVMPYLDGTIYVGGHSKGGNLARYASVYCQKELQDHIMAVFDHDGPGMQKDLSNDENFLAIKDRIYKTVPHDSIIGILLKCDYNFKIIKCNSISIIQHNPYSWNINVDTGDFIYMDTNTYVSRINNLAINKWIDELSEHEREVIINCIFRLFKLANINTVPDLLRFPITNLYRMMISMNDFTKQEKQMCGEAIHRLLKDWNDTIKIVKIHPKSKKIETNKASE